MPPRPPLSRGSVLRAAVELADAEGIDAVSMRRVADRLGVVPMALYKHVADKDDLLDGMVDELIAEFATPAPALPPAPRRAANRSLDTLAAQRDWRPDFRAAVAGARAVVTRHTWARRAIETRTRRSAAVLGHMERLTSILLDGGLSPDLAHHAMHALGNRIWGFSPELFNDPDRADAGAAASRARTGPAPDPADFPAIHAVAADAAARRPGARGATRTSSSTSPSTCSSTPSRPGRPPAGRRRTPLGGRRRPGVSGPPT